MYIVTKITKKDKNYEIIINNSKRLVVSKHIFFNLHIEQDQEIDIKTILTQVRTMQEKEALQRAVYMLSLKDRTELEVIQFLKKHYYADSIIKYVLDRLRKLHLIDDKIYIQRWIDSRMSVEYGAQRIKQDLLKKGFKKDIIDEAILNSSYFNNALNNAINYASRYAARFDELDYQNFQKIKMALMRRGYSYDISNKAVEHIKNSPK